MEGSLTSKAFQSQNSLWSKVTALLSIDGDVIGAHISTSHQSFVVEFPVLITMGTVPLSVAVMPFVFKPYRDSVASVAPELFH
ncbi:hypothetical protein Mapa_013180 [Marchantia paleacea]|nr:hypothetical protein Mapa_013180 [Marchantia paleacea]